MMPTDLPPTKTPHGMAAILREKLLPLRARTLPSNIPWDNEVHDAILALGDYVLTLSNDAVAEAREGNEGSTPSGVTTGPVTEPPSWSTSPIHEAIAKHEARIVEPVPSVGREWWLIPRRSPDSPCYRAYEMYPVQQMRSSNEPYPDQIHVREVTPPDPAAERRRVAGFTRPDAILDSLKEGA